MSFFLLIVQSGDAIQLLIVINLAISFALIGRLWRDVNRALWTRLVVGSFVGFPLELLAFRNAEVDHLKLWAAGAILAFVAFIVFRKREASDQSDETLDYRTPSALAVGALAGSMTTALGMPGPPLVLYLTAVGAGKQATRSISLTFFAGAYGASLILQATAVGVPKAVWITAGALVPVAGLGAWIGHILARRVNERAFHPAVLTLVGATGAYVLVEALLL